MLVDYMQSGPVTGLPEALCPPAALTTPVSLQTSSLGLLECVRGTSLHTKTVTTQQQLLHKLLEVCSVTSSVTSTLDPLSAKTHTLRKPTEKRKKKRHRKRKNSSSMNSQKQTTEPGPDPDAIKMFVGQIPRSMDENDLRKMFEEFGPVYQLNVLRDKVTGQSKGCCFVTFYTRKAALEAQNELHNIKTMGTMQHPIQMKPADCEKRNAEERKLFIGMLSKKCTENDVRMMFAPFGTIEECTVLREQNGQSRGCAFITYASKQCALNAIKNMHHSQTMDQGCRFPLVVKFADTQKEKELKKMQQMQANFLTNPTMGSSGVSSALGPQYLALLQQASAGSNMGALGNLGNLGLGLNALQVQQILAAAAQAAAALQSNPGDASQAQNLQNLQGLAALAAMATNPNMGLSQVNPQNLAALQQLANMNPSTSTASLNPLSNTGNLTPSNSGASALSGNSSGLSLQSHNSSLGASSSSGHQLQQQQQQGNLNGMSNSTGNGSQTGAGMDALSQAYSGIQQYAGLSGLLSQASFPGAFSTQSAAQLQQAAAVSPAGKQTEGPDGANLFIYHLPQEFSDQDLMSMFMPFGNVVSAKVFIDKQTNLSKCFGFVSYDNPMNAQAAIQAMNGFQIGMKRLKVQLKRPKGENKPY